VPGVASVQAGAPAQGEGGRELQALGLDAQKDRSPTVFNLKVKGYAFVDRSPQETYYDYRLTLITVPATDFGRRSSKATRCSHALVPLDGNFKEASGAKYALTYAAYDAIMVGTFLRRVRSKKNRHCEQCLTTGRTQLAIPSGGGEEYYKVNCSSPQNRRLPVAEQLPRQSQLTAFVLSSSSMRLTFTRGFTLTYNFHHCQSFRPKYLRAFR